MKKTVLLIVGFCLIAGMVSAQTFTLEPFSLRLPQDGAEFKAVLNQSALLNGHRINAGESYTLTMKFTASRDINEVWWTFVDNSESAGWWRVLISDDVGIIENVKSGQEVSVRVTFTTTTGATSANRIANSFFIVAKDGRGVPTLNFTEWTLRKN